MIHDNSFISLLNYRYDIEKTILMKNFLLLLYFTVKPVITVLSDSVKTIPGETVQMVCVVQSVPKPDVSTLRLLVYSFNYCIRSKKRMNELSYLSQNINFGFPLLGSMVL